MPVCQVPQSYGIHRTDSTGTFPHVKIQFPGTSTGPERGPSRPTRTPEPDWRSLIRDLRAVFADLPDPRSRRGTRHSLMAVLLTSALAVLRGATNFREMGDRTAELDQDILIEAGARTCPTTGQRIAPSSATIRRVLISLDAHAADTNVCAWIRRVVEDIDHDTDDDLPPGAFEGLPQDQRRLSEAVRNALAADGKVIRRSGGPAGSNANIQVFSAFLHTPQVVISQLQIPESTTEVTCMQALLDPVPLNGRTVTLDAAHTSDPTAQYIIGQDGHYVMTVKGNRDALMRKIAAVLPEAVSETLAHEWVDTSHGRTVIREIWTAPAQGIDFPGAAQVFRIRRRVLDAKGQALSKEIIHGITSLSPEQATGIDLALLVNRHWRIESNHWVRDLVLGEDSQQAYTGNAPHATAMLRNLAIAICRLAGHKQIKRTLQRNASAPRYLEDLLTTLARKINKL